MVIDGIMRKWAGPVCRTGAGGLIMLVMLAVFAPGARSAPVRLNNFVVQLADIHLGPGAEQLQVDMEEEGWLFIRLKGEGRINVKMSSTGKEEIVLDSPGETMRYLPEGTVNLRVSPSRGSKPERIIARRVPHTILYFFREYEPGNPAVDITYTWEELEHSVLHSANTVISRPRDIYESYAERWQEKGGRWLIRQSILPLREEGVDIADFFSELLHNKPWDGAAVDELQTRDNPFLERYADGLRRFTAMPESIGKTVNFWISGIEAFVPSALQGFRVTDEAAFSGGKSLRCLPQNGGGVHRTRTSRMPLEPGREYTLSAYIKAENLTPGGARIFVIDDGWLNVYAPIIPRGGTAGWQRYEAAFTPGPSRYGRYQVIIQGPESGGMWIDAVQLEEGGKAAEFTLGEPNLLANPDFSEGLAGWLSGGVEHNPVRDAVMEHNQFVMPEIYLTTEDTERRALAGIRNRLVDRMRSWTAYGGLIENTVVGLVAYDLKPGASISNIYPDVNHKVWFDMKVHGLATGEGLEGLGGLTFWAAHYASPELLRWMGEVFRHYCIEGETGLMSNYAYKLTHLENPGFDEGLDGWDVSGSVEAVKWHDLPGAEPGDLRRERRWRPMHRGLLRTVRAEGAPANSFGQPIRNLEPGKLYSLKFFSANPEYSDRAVPADVKITGGDVLPGEHTDQFSDRKWSHVWRMAGKRDVFWTMHFRVFRAEDTQGRLEISDAEAGEAYWCFIQLEPYFAGGRK